MVFASMVYCIVEMQDIVRVLIVDDDESDAMLVEDTLDDSSRITFDVEIVTTYEEGVREMCHGKHDVVLLDHQLGAKTGVQLLEEVRGCPSLPPVIMLTGLDPEEADEEAMSAGASDLLTKEEATENAGLLERAVFYALERRRQRKALVESEERHMLAVAGSTDGIWDWNLETGELHGSPKFQRMLGLDEDVSDTGIEVWRAHIFPEDLEQFDEDMRSHFQGASRVFRSEHRIENGTLVRWVRARGVAVRDAAGQVRRIAGSLTDVHAEKLARQQIVHAATHDQLTGVFNRRYLQQFIEEQIQVVAENPARSFSVLYVDLDRFKPMNDGFGHVAGDQIIFESARRLELAVGDKGIVARHGGDEFVCVVTGSERVVLEVAESVQRAFRHPFTLEGRGSRVVTASVGLLHARPFHESHDAVLRDADIAMFKAKGSGRDAVVVFDEDMRKEVLRRFDLENDFGRDLRNGRVKVMYQPIISLATGTCVAAEALTRWTHPRHGAVSPLEFVSIAEETGQIADLGRHVLSEVVKDLKEWSGTGISVNMNLSAIEFADENLVERFEKVAKNIPSGALTIEITESAVVHSEKIVVRHLESLRRLGVHAHLDDFGTGYASVSHLVSLPLEGVKIDMSLIQRIEDPRYQCTVKAVIDLAHGLGMHCVVEGIETKRQLDIVTKLGADFAQGFYLSRPMPAMQLASRIFKQVL